MADLSTLDPSQPPNTQAVSQGALRIRETRDSVLTSFDVEHDLKGPHTFPRGGTAVRGAPEFPGRIFLNTELDFVNYDDGATWSVLHTSQLRGAYSASALALNASYQQVAGVTIATSFGPHLFIIGQAQIALSGAAASAGLILGRLLVDGVVISPNVMAWQHTLSTIGNTIASIPFVMYGFHINALLPLSESFHGISFEMQGPLATVVATNRTLIVHAV